MMSLNKKSSKKFNHFISALLALEEKNQQKNFDLAYMPRSLVMATLPHSRPDNDYFERKSGHYTLSMMGHHQFGLPYGSIPRMFLVWMTGYAITKNSPEIPLGKTLTAFLKKLNLRHGGGERGNATRVREQIMRLLTCKIACIFYDKKNQRCNGSQFNISRSFSLLWHSTSAEKKEFLSGSKIILSEDFFDEIIKKSVPINFDTLSLLRKSSLQIDIYVWLTYRFFSLKKETLIPWKILQTQFGANYSCDSQDMTRGIRNFKTKFLQALKKVCLVYPEANVVPGAKGLVLCPSETHVSVKKKPNGPVDNSSYPR